MYRVYRTASFLTRSLMLLAFAGVPVFSQDARRGKRLYENSTCHACHGDSGDGKGAVAVSSKPALKPLPASFTGKLKYGSDLKSIIGSIRNGIPGTKMIPYKGILRDDEIEDLAKYIQLFQQEKNAPGAGIEPATR